jgi:hypothetical protein
MKTREFLTAVVLSLVLPMLPFAGSPIERKKANREPTPDRNVREDNPSRNKNAGQHRPAPLNQAYRDAFNILQQDNSCSRYFGGSNAAEEVIVQLVAQLQNERMQDNTVGIRMSGGFVTFDKSENGFSYRLFAQAKINTIGPFYKSKTFVQEAFVPGVGSFMPNTREVRVLILLHELAHLLMAPDGRWLIPDDGNNPKQSALNTALIETKCKDQVRLLSKV